MKKKATKKAGGKRSSAKAAWNFDTELPPEAVKQSEAGFEEQQEPVQGPLTTPGGGGEGDGSSSVGHGKPPFGKGGVRTKATALHAIWPDQANNFRPLADPDANHFGEEVEPMENDEGSTHTEEVIKPSKGNNKIEDHSKESDLYNNEQDAAWEKRFQRLKSQHLNTDGDSQQDKSIDNSRSNAPSAIKER